MRNHRRINDLLTLFVIGFALYIIAAPLIPQIAWIFKDKSNGAPYTGELAQTEPEKKSDQPKPIPKDNRIVIPAALIDQPIYTGSNIWVIEYGGSWYKNLNTASPKDQGNTVIVGHRFTYKDPEGAFYHLDKVEVGDKLALYWQGEELMYEVREKKVVPSDAIEVEDNTKERRLTLYTCTPLVTAENRLVIVAYPLGENR